MERLTSALSRAELLAHYSRVLGTRSVQTEVQGRTMLSAPVDELFVSVELRPLDDGRTEAWVLARPLRQAGAASAPRAPVAALPAGAHWLSTLESVDNGRRVRTSVAAVLSSLDASRDFVARQLAERGYQRVAGKEGAAMQMFQRGTDDAMLTVVERDGARLIVLVDSSPP
jgi:hypothetical protein